MAALCTRTLRVPGGARAGGNAARQGLIPTILARVSVRDHRTSLTWAGNSAKLAILPERMWSALWKYIRVGNRK